MAGSKSTWSMKRFAFVWFSMQASRNVVSFTTRTCKAQQSDKAGERERERDGMIITLVLTESGLATTNLKNWGRYLRSPSASLYKAEQTNLAN